MKKLKLMITSVLALIICMLFSITAFAAVPEGGFTDVQKGEVSNAVYEAVTWAVDNGITKGYSDGTFRPSDSCTRAEMAIFLWRIRGKETPANPELYKQFSDADEIPNATAKKAISWAIEEGITKGYSDGTFRPSAPCTRAEMAIFLWRTAGKGFVLDKSLYMTFTDHSSNPNNTANNAISWAVEKGITKGYKEDNTFRPSAPCTRAEMTIFLKRLYSYIQKTTDPDHNHNWKSVTKTVHHDAEYKTVHNDAVYKTVQQFPEWKLYYVCYCGIYYESDDTFGPLYDAHFDEIFCGGWGTHYVSTKEANFKQVLVTEAYDEQLLIKAAYDETVTIGYKCSCGSTKPAESSHTHNWQPVNKIVHHDAEYITFHREAGEEPHTVCECGLDFTIAGFNSASQINEHNKANGCSEKVVQQVIPFEPFDEQILKKAAYYETVANGYECSCGATKK